MNNTHFSPALETITPEIAKEYLRHNVGNRLLRAKYVEQIVRDIKAGEFRTTHQGIAFDANGNLIDGQHRLTAIALAGIPVQMMVTRGVSEESKLVIDTHAKRQISDYFSISDKYSDDKSMRNASIISAVRNLVRCGYRPSYKPTNAELERLMLGLQDQLHDLYDVVSTRGSNVLGSVSAAVLSALMSGEDKAGLHKFITVYLTGNITGCDEYDPGSAFKLSTAVLNAKAKGTRINPDKLYNLAQNAIWHFLRDEETQKLVTSKQPRYVVDTKIYKILKGESK